MIYVKNNQEVKVASEFVYQVEVYRMWKRGAYLLDDTFYKTTKPLNLKKFPLLLKRKTYTIRRFVTLICAPEFYLINQGYNCKEE